MPPYPTTTMKLGSHGESVRQLQSLLNRDYPAYSKLVADGEYGAKTEAVIREFQRRAGLRVTGVADGQTLDKLDELTVQNSGEMKGCGDGIWAGPTTSCEFARNVKSTYFSVPGDSIEIDVFSPVTAKTYTMACVRTGDQVTCRGGNAAVVTFSY